MALWFLKHRLMPYQICYELYPSDLQKYLESPELWDFAELTVVPAKRDECSTYQPADAVPGREVLGPAWAWTALLCRSFQHVKAWPRALPAWALFHALHHAAHAVGQDVGL